MTEALAWGCTLAVALTSYETGRGGSSNSIVGFVTMSRLTGRLIGGMLGERTFAAGLSVRDIGTGSRAWCSKTKRLS
jgi:cytochrome b